MNQAALEKMLDRFKRGLVSRNDVVETLRDLPVVELGYATVDTHRSLRQGFPEAVLGQWKTAEHCIGIVSALLGRKQPVMVTRLQSEKAEALKAAFPQGVWHPTARIFEIRKKTSRTRGTVAVVSAGTSDLPIAEEAALTAEAHGCRVRRVTDVGVAGIHRLLRRRKEIQSADAVVAVAGMEGALASVLGGLVSCPVVAVPTSIGYGASMNGLAALLGMMTSCASNVAVVNIDNGFGAGFYAALIARRSKR